MTPSGPVTRILERIAEGDREAAEELYPVVYTELKRLAGARMARERPSHTLTPTALVHETYLRLVGDREREGGGGADGAPGWENRRHFFGAAAQAMRRILVEHARSRARRKRGGERRRTTLDEQAAISDPPSEEVLALDEALSRLEERDETMASVVKLRYFAGLTVPETARALELAPRTVDRQWRAAKAWLYRELSRTPG